MKLTKNYIPKGDIEGFPYEVLRAMCDEQVKQGNEENVENKRIINVY